MRKLLFVAVATALLTLGPGLNAQQPPAQTEKAKPGEAKGAAETLTGCLTAGSGQGSYTLKTEGGGDVAVSGSADLAKHVGHTVGLTGTMHVQGGTKTLKADKIEHVATSCKG